jgi:hypothetical protein
LKLGIYPIRFEIMKRETVFLQYICLTRNRNLEIKTHNKWKYEGDLCVGCGENVESEEELMMCESLSASNEKLNKTIPAIGFSQTN